MRKPKHVYFLPVSVLPGQMVVTPPYHSPAAQGTWSRQDRLGFGAILL